MPGDSVITVDAEETSLNMNYHDALIIQEDAVNFVTRERQFPVCFESRSWASQVSDGKITPNETRKEKE